LVFKHLILATLRKIKICVKKKRGVYSNITKGNVRSSVGDIQKVRVMLLDEKHNLEKDFNVRVSLQV
jgi:hypothetical protein